MIKCIIIEDEARGRNALSHLISEYSDRLALIGMAENGEQGKTLIEQLQPDLIFLDVEMPHKNGFEMLSELGDYHFDIIFTTAYDQYAIKAFKFSAIDYLLKPIDADELDEALRKVFEKHQKKSSIQPSVEALLYNIKQLQGQPKKLALPTIDGIILTDIKDIVRCESDGNYTRFFLMGQKPLMVSKTLKDYEELLEQEDFIRVHHSHLINLWHLKKYVKGEGGMAVMNDGSEVEISRRKKEHFLQKLHFFSTR
jgi:two-component system LytT family response regulator